MAITVRVREDHQPKDAGPKSYIWLSGELRKKFLQICAETGRSQQEVGVDIFKQALAETQVRKS